MRKLILLLLCASAFATTTVTGRISTLGTGTVGSGAYVRFWLRGCAGNQPRISGVGIIAPTQGGVFYFDFPANGSGIISGTLYSNRDATGLLGGEIECGGSYTATWYGMQAFVNGKGGPEVPVFADNTVGIDISTVTPITSLPVTSAPTPGQLSTTPFASLSAANNGALIYCIDCKNVPDDAATAGQVCTGGGHGAFAKRENARWDCN